MSNWAQSIWMIKRIKKFFNFDSQINKLSTEINKYNINSQIIKGDYDSIKEDLDSLSEDTDEVLEALSDKIDNVAAKYTILAGDGENKGKIDQIEQGLTDRNNAFFTTLEDLPTIETGAGSLGFIIEGSE